MLSRKQYGLMLTLTVFAAFAGGILSGRLFAVQPVEAQKIAPKAAPPTNVMIVPAEGLIFKTPSGKVVAMMEGDKVGGRFGVYNTDTGETVAVMGAAPYGGVFALYNNEGKTLGSMAATPNGGVLGLYDKNEKTLWEAP
ncbi:MAG: hypothetical protein QOH49_4990 [Acidobacteriota bacterium]|jgi:hypothetical protein|nr:hypothetical protein [Acidobacteriota bacterium]